MRRPRRNTRVLPLPKAPSTPVTDDLSLSYFLRMGYWPAAERERQFAKEPDRTERMFVRAGYLISEVTFFLEEQGWVMGYMLGYNDGRSGLSVTPEAAIREHRSRALIELPGGSPYGLLTVGYVYDLRRWAEGVCRGHDLARELVRYGCSLPPLGYALLRDELLGYVDLPYELACQIALYLTRDPVNQYWLSFTVVL